MFYGRSSGSHFYFNPVMHACDIFSVLTSDRPHDVHLVELL